MDKKLGLDSNSTLSDNITRIRMQRAKLSSPEVLQQLIVVTREGGFSRWELADVRTIQANLASRGDQDAEALHGLVEEILEAHEAEGIFKRLISLKEVFRENKLPSLAWRENPLSSERVAEHAEKIQALQKELLKNPKLKVEDRVFHQKLVLGRTCKFVVRTDLPAFAKIGPFAQPGEFRAAIRFSNGLGVPFPDKDPDLRGVAIKFFTKDGVEADTVMTNAPASVARDADQFLRGAEVVVKQQVAGGGLKGMLAAGEEVVKGLFEERGFNLFETLRMAKEITKQTVLNRPESLATQQFWGSVVRLGDYAVRMTLVPAEDAPRGTKGDKDDDDYLRKDLLFRIQDGGVKYTLRLLFFTDEERTPLNDASKAWDASPVQVEVAAVELSASQPGEAATDEEINKMPFNPTNGFEGLAITRAREEIYRKSAEGRGASGREDYDRFFHPVS